MGVSQLPPIQPIAVTNDQAAKLIGTNDKQIRRAIYARELPAVRLGKSYSIAIVDLTRWFERKKKFICDRNARYCREVSQGELGGKVDSRKSAASGTSPISI